MTKQAILTFLHYVNQIVHGLSQEDPEKKELLKAFTYRILATLDGVEGPDADWKGLFLLPRASMPETLKPLDKDYLHDLWVTIEQS